MSGLSSPIQQFVTQTCQIKGMMTHGNHAGAAVRTDDSCRQSVRASFGFRHRGAIGALPLAPAALAIILSAPETVEGAPAALALNAAGWICFLLYVGMRLWATLFVGGRKDRELQTEGPYSLCRNPLYLGSFCFALAIACFLKSTWFGLVLVFVFLVYLVFVVQAEEHFLELRFQEDYRNYCRRTPRFWPKWSGFRSPAIVRVDLKLLRTEVRRLAGSALLVIGLQLVMQFHSQPWWPAWLHLW